MSVRNNYVIIETRDITTDYTSKEFATNEDYRHIIEIMFEGTGVNFTLKLEGSVSREYWGDIPLQNSEGVVQLINADESALPIFIETPTKFPFLRLKLENVTGTIQNFRVSLGKKS